MTRNNAPNRSLSPWEVELALAEIEKGHQLAGHFPSAEALERARQVLTGAITYDEAIAQLDAKWGRRAQ